MTWIEKTWTHFPGERYAQDDLARYLPRWLPQKELALAERLFRQSGVHSRHLAVPPEEQFDLRRTFAEKNALYAAAIAREIEAVARRIAADVPAAALESVDLLVTASCTGFQIPAMDALLVDRLGLPRSMRRLNLTEHGCAAGAAAIGTAHEWLAAHPTRRALVVCSELCSVTFQPDDRSGEALVAAAIFGDGSAAALLAGADAAPRPSGRARIRATFRELFARTQHFMGFEVRDTGLKIKLSQDVVRFSKTGLAAFFARACDAWDVPGPAAFLTGAVHPGGRRILEVLEDDCGFSTEVTRTSWEVLREHGNMSSVSVLAALDRLLASPPDGSRGPALLSAFGPGFCAELSLLELAAAGT